MQRRHRGLRPVRHFELAQDIAYVNACGFLGHAERMGDVAVGAAFHQEVEHREFARGELVEGSRSASRSAIGFGKYG